jgi:(p)ppGpp synthase/HD superfamily hydrolase
MDADNDTLEKAIALAVETHSGQIDKVGAAYILHPLRVMSRMSTNTERIAAVLHDAVEDSDGRVTVELIAALGVPAAAVEAIRLLTRTDDGSDAGYQAYIQRLSTNPIALKVKLADLENNLDIRRLSEVGPRDAARLSKYLKTYRKLQAVAAARAEAGL